MDLFNSISAAEQQAAANALQRHHTSVADRRQALVNVADQRRYQAMLDGVKDWQPPDLPDLGAFSSIILNFETTGVKWYAGDRIISAVLLTPDGVSRYLPIRHALGPNLPEDAFFEWLRREVRGKHIDNHNTKFDLHMARVEGIDLEAQGCTFGNVAFQAALLDDHRKRFNLDLLSKDFLGWDVETDGLGKLPPHVANEGEFHKLPAGLVAPYGLRNVEQVSQLLTYFKPRIESEGLNRVLQLENAVIPVVVEMEHNGAPLDVELLNRWCVESELDVREALVAIRSETGLDLESTSRAEAVRLFHHLGLPLPSDPEDPDKVSFADALIKDLLHPAVQNFRKASQLESLRSKFLLKYQRSVARDGILRYELHQLPYQRDDAGEGGAVSGRFSSASPSRTEGANIQQVFGADAQKKKRPYTSKYLVKQLFKPERGVFVNADASQLQFRLFAHYANDSRIVQAYIEDPTADFHNVVGSLIKEHAHLDLTRTHTKNVNFAQVFGAGVPKMALQLGIPPEEIPSYPAWAEACKNRTTHQVGGPRFQEAVRLSETYHTMFPSVKPLLGLTSHLAMPGHRSGERGCGRACREFYRQGYSHRGWVRTFEGRRARFNEGDRFYSALNRVIQGTEGDVMKTILVIVHNMRQELGYTGRFCVHDSLAGDLQGDPTRFKDVLNQQHMEFRVPIRFDVGTGASWAEAK